MRDDTVTMIVSNIIMYEMERSDGFDVADNMEKY